MGGKESVPADIKGHPDMFYRGLEEAKEGRYQTAEFYFHQALRQHAGRSFWVEMVNTFYGKAPKTGRKKRGDNVSTDSGELNAQGLQRLDSEDDDEDQSKDTHDPSSHPSNANVIKMVDFPLDESVVSILDYIRMMADIVNAYLCHKMDDKNTNLAFVHCCYLSIHCQILFFLLVIWDAENAELLKKLEDGVLFEIDENLSENDAKNQKNKKQDKKSKSKGNSYASTMEGMGSEASQNVLATGKNYYPVEDENLKDDEDEADDGVSRGKMNANRKKNAWKIGSRDEMPTGTDILMARRTVFAFVRHIWAGVVFNYCSIALQYIEKRCLPTEVKKINVIHQNILTAASTCVWDLRNVFLAEGEGNSLAVSLLKRMPENKEFTFDAEAAKNAGNIDEASGGVSGNDSKVSSQFFASLTGGVSAVGAGGGGVNSAMQTFLTISSSFSPTYALIMDTNMNIPVRLNIRVDTPKSKLCTNKLRPPGSYNLFQYLNWYTIQDVFLVAGYNSRYLNKMLPYYLMPAGSEESSFVCKLKASVKTLSNGVGNTLVQKEKDSEVQRLASTETENFLDPAQRELMKNDLVKNQAVMERIQSQKSYYNPLLKQNDPYTLKIVVFEEDFMHAVYPILIQSRVFSKIGRADEAEDWMNFLLHAMGELYGKESQEYMYINRVMEAYKQ